MNWTNVPLNNSKLFITAILYGGCEIYVPVKEDVTTEELEEIRMDLKSFSNLQSWLAEADGDDIA